MEEQEYGSDSPSIVRLKVKKVFKEFDKVYRPPNIANLSEKIDGLIKENEALAEQIKNLQSELNHINSPLNKLFAWICKIIKK